MTNFKRTLKTSQQLEYGVFQFLDHFLGKRRGTKVYGKKRENFNKRVSAEIKQSGIGKSILIERRENLSWAEFKNYYRKNGIPVIFDGIAKDWECIKNWSLNYFKELHGSDEIVMMGEKDKYEATTLLEVINNIQSGKKIYYKFYPLLKRHPEHINDFDYKWLRAGKTSLSLIEAFRIFLGAKDTITKLHSENTCNLFVEVCGEKKWILYPPSCNFIMNPNPTRSYLRSPSGTYDPFNSGKETIDSLFRYVDRYEAVLKPGDVLWNPPFYWHTVTNDTDSIGVAYRWFDPFYAFKIFKLYMFLDLFATNPPIWKFFKLSKEDLNLVFLSKNGLLDKYLREREKK